MSFIVMAGLLAMASACAGPARYTALDAPSSSKMTKIAEQQLGFIPKWLEDSLRNGRTLSTLDAVRSWMADPRRSEYDDPTSPDRYWGPGGDRPLRPWAPNDSNLPYWNVLSEVAIPGAPEFLVAVYAYGGYDDNAMDFFGPNYDTWGLACGTIAVTLTAPNPTATSKPADCPASIPERAPSRP